MINVAILGSTGSIGTQTLAVLDHLEGYQVVGLSAHSNVKLLKNQANAYQPKTVVIGNKNAKADFKSVDVQVLSGEEGLCELATHPDVDLVVVAVVGSAGLKPTLAALEAGKRVAIANKETLVAAGHLVMKYRSQIIPIDSEHNAVWQCLDGKNEEEIAEVILTASGGPFHTTPEDLSTVTLSQALKHPNWDMGGKITIDSATLMNKGLEVIEAHWLFELPYEQIKVVVHPQSTIHSMVRFIDGSIIAQMGTTDMRLPIQYALTYPKIKASQVEPLDLTQMRDLTFSAPDFKRFPCLQLAYDAGKTGGTLPTVMNAANEIAVSMFMKQNIGFMDIPRIVAAVMEQHQPRYDLPLEEILAVDAQARIIAQELAVREG